MTQMSSPSYHMHFEVHHMILVLDVKTGFNDLTIISADN